MSLASPRVVGAQQPPVRVAQRREHELGAGAGGVEVVVRARARRRRRRARRSSARSSGQPLVVEARADALRARGSSSVRDLAARRVGAERDEDVRALEVAASVTPKNSIATSRPVAEHVADSPASRRRSGPPRPRSRRPARCRSRPRGRASRAAPSPASPPPPRAALLAGDLPAVQVGAREQRVVVEHLLEVGDEPGGVDRCSGAKPPPTWSWMPPRGHARAACPAPFGLAAREQELDR